MANVFLSILLVGLSVRQMLTLKVAPEVNTEPAPGIYYIEELDEHKDAYTKMATMRNGKKLSATDHLCHNAHTECVKTVETTDLVCAHHERYGLVNFPSLCEIRFQNCLVQSREVQFGKKNKHGKFYYNGKLKGCDYYVEKSDTVADAVKQYFSEDKNHKLNAYNAKEKEKMKTKNNIKK